MPIDSRLTGEQRYAIDAIDAMNDNGLGVPPEMDSSAMRFPGRSRI